MLKKIKSLYIAQIVFSLLEESTKLKLVKYNKVLQKRININIINYKAFSGRYIIFRKNGKVKEYDSYNDTLIFEGGYLNGKRNGKGKEYDEYNGNLKFEGEYSNGKRVKRKI